MEIGVVGRKRKRLHAGGTLSTRNLVDGLHKIGHEVVRADKSLERLKDAEIILLCNNHRIRETEEFCREKGVPFIARMNGNLSCPARRHVKISNGFGAPCLDCNFSKGLKCFFLNETNKASGVFDRLYHFLSFPFLFAGDKKRISSLNRAEKVVCTSPTLKNQMKRAGVRKNKLKAIPQPVSKYFSEKTSDIETEKKALFCGGISEVKGTHLAGQAVSKVDALDLILVGGGDEKMLRDLERLLGKRLHYKGSVPHDEVEEYYARSYMTLFTSLWLEPFGRTWAESLMAGTPVVAFKGRGGPSDYLTHEKNALLAGCNMESLVKQIRRLLEDEELYEKISENGREFALQELTPKKIARRYEQVIREVVG
ncbi:hypothetical protein AKJ53_00925 [candidate division MSBL1 archaeon SCGC-AAA382F02]|uniref:Glycosyl transferase family 1 domain-containing protein n=1 Tax=candidate division MSBL1 archaeon SCGC-AAA382F02 TaxID=1698282 RepID=A0A133VIJ7_9EURY|nr:hypothetical protein AKJ53_00925 [candidate division MSBL1 archaeon SCGC-AAA382F02]